ncbi:MAG: hypothetical protein JWL76_516 [Thermoleophilia bacterium]|nr:hypothetical protein [Thermoleophilia bacterium]
MTVTWIRSRATALLLALGTFVLALFIASAPAQAAAEDHTLQASVGPDFVISLTQGGQPVTSLDAGTYTIEVDDKGDAHNFHLSGPGVEESTEVPEVGKKTWTVDLKEGTYKYQCDPHADGMNGSFTVNAAADAPATEPSTQADTGAADTGAAATGAATTQTNPPASELPFTGLDAVGIAWLGASLLAGGLALAYFGGRQRAKRHGA